MSDETASDVTDETVETWGVMDPTTGWYGFTDTSQAAAERRLLGLSMKDPNLVLVTRSCRTRTEKWYGDTKVVPWHSPCSWVAEGDEMGRQIGPSWCARHQHTEGTPVPPEHIRGADVMADVVGHHKKRPICATPADAAASPVKSGSPSIDQGNTREKSL